MAAINASSRVKACIECRQQKLRCDAPQSKPCSRCRKSGVECIISDTFHRSKRQSKAEMQREIDRLRAEAETSGQPRQDSITIPADTASTSSPVDSLSGSASGFNAGTLSSDYLLSSPEDPNLPQGIQLLSFRSATKARTLDQVQLPAQQIEDCFSYFFRHYHPLMPILEPDQDPNQYYAYSPLLFWVIIAIGSRRYSQDPTIFDRLATRVMTLAMISATKIPRYVETIQALTLLCCWPLPMDSIYQDPSLMFAGAASQLAVQNGLHMFSRRQDFAKPALGADEGQEIFRATLWGYSKVVAQLTSISSGLPSYQVSDAFDMLPMHPHHQEVVSRLPPRVFWTQKMQKTFTNAIGQLMTCQSLMTDGSDGSALRSLIDIFDDQIEDLKRESGECLNPKDVALARLNIRAFEFFDESESDKPSRLIELFTIAISFIDSLVSDDQATDFALYCPQWFYRSLTLANSVLLRVSKCHLSRYVDVKEGMKRYFAAIQLLRKRSLQFNDLDASGAKIFTQLWQSKKVFLQRNGTQNGLRVRLKSRGVRSPSPEQARVVPLTMSHQAMGIVYDCYWYWVQEFTGQRDPYSGRNDSLSSAQHGDALVSQPGHRGNQQLVLAGASQAFDQGETPSDFSSGTEAMYYGLQSSDAFCPEWEWPHALYNFGNLMFEYDQLPS